MMPKRHPSDERDGRAGIVIAKLPWRYAAFYAAQYAINAVYQNFSPVYFRSIGLDKAAIGILAALSPIVAILVQPVWGTLADRSKSKNAILKLLLAGAAVSTAAYAVSPAYGWLAAMVAVNAVFYTSVAPLGDAVVLERISREGYRFGPIRWAGTVAFAAVAVVAGSAIGDEPGRVIFLTAGLTAVCLATVFFIPGVSGHQAKIRRSMKDLFRIRPLMLLIAASCAMMVTMGAFYAFFSVYFTEELGGSPALLGWAFFISSASETPFLFLSDRIMKKLGAPKMLLLSCGAMALRWALLAIAGDAVFALFTQVLHGGCFIVLSYTMIRYVDAAAPSELKASGQMLYAMISINLARTLGSLAGGTLSEWLGLPAVFWASCGLAMITMGFLFGCIRRGALPAGV